MTRARRSRCRDAALGAVLAVVLTGCGGLPTSGPVVEGRRLGDSNQEPVRVSAQGPAAGANQETIARGFVLAGEDTDESHQVGREFLAPASVDLWRSSSQDVIIYDSLADGLHTRLLGTDRVKVWVTAVARVSPDGRYQELPPGTAVTATFGVRKVSGEWRLTLPDTGFGLWVDTNAFDRLYGIRDVFYVTPTGRRLVPDPRWFPTKTSRLATALARAQLDPVPAYLRGALFSGVPPKTNLAVDSVPVDDSGRAVVDLTAPALEADPDERTAMWAQLTDTLLQVPAVTRVALSSQGAGLELPSGGSAASSADELGFAEVASTQVGTALLRQGDTITRIDPRFIPDKAVGTKAPKTQAQDTDVANIPAGWAFLGLSSDGKQIAAVGGNGEDLSLWQASAPMIRVDPFATDLTRPAYDAAGYLWVGGLDPAGQGRIFVLNTSTKNAVPKPTVVDAPWLTGRKVIALTVAPDEARMLVVTTKLDGTDPQLGMGGVVRAPNGQPTSVATPLRQAQPLTLIRDAVWLDPTTYAVLGRIGDAEPVRPWIGSVGSGLDGVRRRGSADPADARLADVPDGRTITSVGGPRGLIVLTDSGAVLARAGGAWRRISTGTDLLVPGR